MKKRLAIFVLGSLCLSSMGWAQGPGKGKRKVIPEAVKAYVQEQVIPEVEKQREKLNEVLSPAEQAAVVEIQMGLKELKEEGKALREQMRELRESHEGEGRPELPEALRTGLRAQHKQQRQLMTQAWEIVDAHEADLYTLLEELEAKGEVWKEEIHSLMEGQKGERDAMKPRGREHGNWDRPGPHKGRKRGGRRMSLMGMARWHSPVMFLLFDANAFGEMEKPEMDLNTFPNPAEDQNTLEYSVEQAGKVTINLLDDTGKIVKQLVSTLKEAGSHTERVDLSDLRPGVYVYRIESNGTVKTQKLVVE